MGRQFRYDGKLFYTESLINQLRQVVGRNRTQDACRLSWANDGKLRSNQMQAEIVAQIAEQLTVRFVANMAQVTVGYQARPTVISKRLTVEWTSERLNAIICD